MYVSSAFSQCIKESVEEKFYTPNIDPLELIKMMENEPRLDELEAVSKKMVEPWPNTYSFTKALAEEVVRRRRDKMPIAIVRPSIGRLKPRQLPTSVQHNDFTFISFPVAQ